MLTGSTDSEFVHLAWRRDHKDLTSLNHWQFADTTGSLVDQLGVRDLTSVYKAFTREALEAIDIGTIHSNGYSFQIEMTYRLHLHGMRITEVPIVFAPSACAICLAV